MTILGKDKIRSLTVVGKSFINGEQISISVPPRWKLDQRKLTLYENDLNYVSSHTGANTRTILGKLDHE